MTTLWSANILLVLVWAALAGIALAAVFGAAHPGLGLAAGAFLIGQLLREYLRIYQFSTLRVAGVLITDGLYVALALAGLGALHFGSGGHSLANVLWVLALAGAVSAGVTIAGDRAAFRLRGDQAARTLYRHIWRVHARWALFGAMSTETQGRGHVFLVGMIFGPAAVGILQAGQMVFRPMNMAQLAWSRVGRPILARHFAAQENGAAMRFAHVSALGLTIIALLYGAVIWFGWPLLQAHVLGPDYAGVTETIWLWAAVMALAVVRAVYSNAAQALIAFRQLGHASFAGMLTTLAALAAILASGAPYVMTLFALIIGEIAVLIMISAILIRRLRLRRIAQASPSS